MDFKVHITYDGKRHNFRRQATIDPQDGSLSLLVRSEHGDNYECHACLERVRFVDDELEQSGVEHNWDQKEERLTFPNAHVATIDEALGFLRKALPTATVDFSS